MLIPRNAYALRPEAGARCGSAARRDLCGGCRVTGIPTATVRCWLTVTTGRDQIPRPDRRRGRLGVGFYIRNDLASNVWIGLFIEHHRARYPGLRVHNPDIKCPTVPHHALQNALEGTGVCEARDTTRLSPIYAAQ